MSQNGPIPIEGYLKRLYGYAFALCGDAHEAQDLVQQCAARRVPEDEPAYRAWLFRILRNEFLDRRRRHKTVAAALEAKAAEPEMVFWTGDERFINVLTVQA